MWQKLQGLIIRNRRQEREWSQAALCTGICEVSYLSRIERGKVEGSSEVLDLLFQRLGIQWRDDPDFCKEASEWLEDCYDRLFAGERLEEIAKMLKRREVELRDSPFCLDWFLLFWAAAGQSPGELGGFVTAMDTRQRNLYMCLTRQFQELLRVSDRSYFLLEAGKWAYSQEDYSFAVVCFQRGLEQAAREGSVYVQFWCRLYLGNCYSDLNRLEQAREHYVVASRMIRALGDQSDLSQIAYCLASTELQMNQVEPAFRRLMEHPLEHDPLYFHKLAICYEKLGHYQEASAALDRALELPCEPPMDLEALDQMCALVRYRLDHAEYTKDPAYGKVLCDCFEVMRERLPVGFIRFHLPWLEEWYVSNRQYRQAYELLHKFVQ